MCVQYIVHVHCMYIRGTRSTPGKLLSARYSKQVSVGGIDEDGVQSHTILLVIFHYKDPKAGSHMEEELKPVLVVGIYSHKSAGTCVI